MAIEQAWLLKGFVLAHNAPPEVVEAAEAVIATITDAGTRITGSPLPPLPDVLPHFHEGQVREVESISFNDQPVENTTLKPEAKERKPWSPEAKAAAAERMRAMQARKKAEKEAGRPTAVESAPEFSEAERRITVPAPRRKSTLADAEWPEIKQMLVDGKTRATIASDFDEEPEDLDYFIESCQRREQREGNFAAPLQAGA